MPISDDQTRLGHMLDAAAKAVELTRDIEKTAFEVDEVRFLAIVRLLEIVGEASKRVSAEARDSLPSVPWKMIAGTRDRLIHGYFDVDPDIVWNICRNDLPALVDQLKRALE